MKLKLEISEKMIQYFSFIVVLILLVAFTLSFSYITAGGGTCYCNSCSDCSNALADPACSDVILTNDISLTTSGTYCVQGASYKTFDCNGSLIVGDGSAGSIGVYFPKDTISFSVRNCNIRNFERGVYINRGSQICTVRNTNIKDVGYGVRIRDSCPYTSITNTEVNGSYFYAIRVPGSEYSTLRNIYIENAGNPSSYSALILSFSPFSVVENVKIMHSFQGLVIDNSNGTSVKNISIYNTTGSSHLRIDLSSNVKVNGVNSSLGYSSLIYITGSPNLTLNNTVASNNLDKNGLSIDSSNGLFIYNGTFYNNTVYGASISSDNSIIKYITSYENRDTGIVIGGSSNDIYSLTSYSQGGHGISLSELFHSSVDGVVIYNAKNKEGLYIRNSENLSIKNVKSYNNPDVDSNGIILSNSSNITIRNALVENNSLAGISMPYNYVEGNKIINITSKNNKYGVYLYFTRGIIIKDSTITSNSLYGLYISSLSNGTLIYNNYFNNTDNVYTFYLTSLLNYWNISLQAGNNIVGGSLLGGNFWATPSGNGFSELCDDNDSNGICDSPYPLISGDDDIDYYPLVIVPANATYVKGNIFFVDPTPPNDTILYNRDYLEVNATTNLTENYTKIVLHLYNYTSYYSSYTCDSPPIKPCYYNFTSLPSDVYYILAELYMINFTVYQSEVRVIALTNTSLYCTP